MIRTNFGRLPPGEKTPNSAYRQPILDCLRQMGDVGRAADVLECVERQPKNRHHCTVGVLRRGDASEPGLTIFNIVKPK